MKVLIIRPNDQPGVNISKNIVKYSKHDCTVITRDMDLRSYYDDYDVVLYHNLNDIIYDNRKHVYNMVKNSDYKISVGVQSHRVLDRGFMPRVDALDNIVGICSPTENHLMEVKQALNNKDLVYVVTPYSADEELFKPTREIDESGRDKLKVGFVGSYTACKQFRLVTEAAFRILKDEVEPLLYGQVGKRIPHNKMCEEYNKMDCMVVSSLVNEVRPHETGPVPPIEAAMCGRPTITTECGQMPTTFDDTQAIFYDGTVDGLVSALKKFVGSRKLCKEMGQNARTQMLTVRSWKNIIKPQDLFFEKVYERSQS